MIKIYFSSNDNKNISSEIDLSGNKQDFSELNKTLTKFLKSDEQHIKIDADTEISSFPYDKMLQSLVVSKSKTPNLVSVIDENILQIEGSIDCLETLISNIEYVKDGYHIHYEYYEGNEWISPDSIPLIITSKE